MDTGLGPIPSGIASILVVCALAEVSWRMIEAPLIGYAQKRFPRAEKKNAAPASSEGGVIVSYAE